MPFIVYIIKSKKTNKFYVGQTNDLDDRLKRHNAGRSKSTKHGTPWELVRTFQFESRNEAVTLERKIKGRGIARFMKDSASR